MSRGPNMDPWAIQCGSRLMYHMTEQALSDTFPTITAYTINEIYSFWAANTSIPAPPFAFLDSLIPGLSPEKNPQNMHSATPSSSSSCHKCREKLGLGNQTHTTQTKYAAVLLSCRSILSEQLSAWSICWHSGIISARFIHCVIPPGLEDFTKSDVTQSDFLETVFGVFGDVGYEMVFYGRKTVTGDRLDLSVSDKYWRFFLWNGVFSFVILRHHLWSCLFTAKTVSSWNGSALFQQTLSEVQPSRSNPEKSSATCSSPVCSTFWNAP